MTISPKPQPETEQLIKDLTQLRNIALGFLATSGIIESVELPNCTITQRTVITDSGYRIQETKSIPENAASYLLRVSSPIMPKNAKDTGERLSVKWTDEVPSNGVVLKETVKADGEAIEEPTVLLFHRSEQVRRLARNIKRDKKP